ncbi:MAG TPA: helix-turn-helix transcriptional regulator [Streptosporangiaceae bacterium]|nr:helix-turn-helix transcriptional regulator [Streptosporangiaceae bacterium]
MAGEDWRRLSDYVIARRVELGMRDRRALAAATGVTDRTLGKLENGHRVSASTLGVIENHLGWTPGSCRRILAGGEPGAVAPAATAAAATAAAATAVADAAATGEAGYEDPTLRHLADTPGLPPDVVRGLIALARNWRDEQDDTGEAASRHA